MSDYLDRMSEIQNERNGEPKPKPTNVVDQMPAADTGFPWAEIGTGIKDALLTAGDAASFYLSSPAAAIAGGSIAPYGEPREGVPSFMSGLSGEPFARSYKDEFLHQREIYNDALGRLEEVPHTHGLLDDVLGLVGGAASPINKAFDAAAEGSRLLNKGVSRVANRFKSGAGAGAGSAALSSAALGNDPGTIALDALAGVVGGGISQALLGETLSPLVAKAKANAGDVKMLSGLVDSFSAQDDTFSPEMIRRSLQEMGADDTVIETLLKNQEPSEQAETLRRFYNMIADASFPKQSISAERDTKLGRESVERFNAALAGLRDIGDVAAQDVRDMMDASVGPITTRNQLATEIKELNEGVAAQMDSLRRTQPVEGDPPGFTPVGATTINGKGAVGEIRSGFLNRLGVKDFSEIGGANSGAMKAYNYFVDQLRSVENERFTGAARRQAVLGGEGNLERDLQVLPAEMPLATLYNARVNLAAQMRESYSAGYNAEDRRAFAMLLKDVDEAIQSYYPGGEAMRAAYAKNMEALDAYDLGYDLFASPTFDMTRRTDDVRTAYAGANFEEFMEYVGNKPHMKEGFAKGFTAAMRTAMDGENPVAIMRRLLGDQDLTDRTQVLLGSERNKKILEEVLGKDDAEALISLTNSTLLKNVDAMERYLTSVKGGVPKPEEMGAAIDYITTSNETGILHAMPAMGALIRKFYTDPIDKKKMGEALLRHISGASYEKKTTLPRRPGPSTKDRMLRAADVAFGSKPVKGSVGGVSVVNPDTEPSEEDVAQQLQDADAKQIQDYLDAIRGATQE